MMNPYWSCLTNYADKLLNTLFIFLIILYIL